MKLRLLDWKQAALGSILSMIGALLVAFGSEDTYEHAPRLFGLMQVFLGLLMIYGAHGPEEGN